MILYLLKSGLCLALLLAFYHLVLEREKMHRFNRFYLLGSVLFSFLAPAFIIYIEAIPTVLEAVPTTIVESSTNSQETSSPVITPIDESINYITYFFWFYGLITSILLLRFLKSLLNIIQKIRRNKKTIYSNATIVLVNDEILPHTFWNYIFINKIAFEAKEIEEELFTHELTHVTQKHTVDVLLIEALQILFWINPLFFLLKKAVQLNHEFLADDSVIASHNNISKYQHLLLNKAAWKNDYYLASNLNYSLTKKRLLMMKTTNSRTNIFLKKLAIIPLLTGLVFLFANRVEAQTTKKKPQVLEVKQVQIGITKAKLIEYQDYMKGVSKNSILKLKDVKKMRALYHKMSKAQKKTVTNIYEFLPPPPPPRKLKEIKSEKIPKPVKIEVIKKEKIEKPKDFIIIETKSGKKTVDLKGFTKGEILYIKKNPDCIGEVMSDGEMIEIFEIPMDLDENGEIIEEEFEIIEEEIPVKKKSDLNTFEKRMTNSLIKEVEIVETTNIYNFEIKLEKKGKQIKLKCLKGCSWEKLSFNLKRNLPRVVNKQGLNTVNARNTDDDFHFVLMQNKNVFDLKSFKNTKWKGLSGSAKEDMKILINNKGVRNYK